MDALGSCCSGSLDAQGICCNGPVDECGVCNGNAACNVRALLLATLPNAPLWLGVTSPAGRRLKGAIQDAVVAAITKMQGKPFDKSYCSITLSAVSKIAVADDASSSTSTQSGPARSGSHDVTVSKSGAGNTAQGTAASDPAVRTGGQVHGSIEPVDPVAGATRGGGTRGSGSAGVGHSASSHKPGSSSGSQSSVSYDSLGWISVGEAMSQQAHDGGVGNSLAAVGGSARAFQNHAAPDIEGSQTKAASERELGSSSSWGGSSILPRDSIASGGMARGATGAVDGAKGDWPSEGPTRKALSIPAEELLWGTNADGSCLALKQPEQEPTAGTGISNSQEARSAALPTRQLAAAAKSMVPLNTNSSMPNPGTGSSNSSSNSSRKVPSRGPVLVGSDSSSEQPPSDGHLPASSTVGSGTTSGSTSLSPSPVPATATLTTPKPTNSSSSSMNNSTAANSTVGSSSSGNNIQVDILLRNPGPSVRLVPDTATVLLALQQLLLHPLPLPLSKKDFLVFQEVESIRRTGTCGDGVCQVCV